MHTGGVHVGARLPHPNAGHFTSNTPGNAETRARLKYPGEREG